MKSSNSASRNFQEIEITPLLIVRLKRAYLVPVTVKTTLILKCLFCTNSVLLLPFKGHFTILHTLAFPHLCGLSSSLQRSPSKPAFSCILRVCFECIANHNVLQTESRIFLKVIAFSAAHATHATIVIFRHTHTLEE